MGSSDEGMTAEDRVIYDPAVSAMIDRELDRMAYLIGGSWTATEAMRAKRDLRLVLERLVWAVVRWERGE